MTRLGVVCLIVSAALLAGCGSAGDGAAGAAKPFAYSEPTIDRFVTLCLQRPKVTVAKCACVLERYRSEASEADFLKALGEASPGGRMSVILGECQMDGVAGFVAKPAGSVTAPAGGGSSSEVRQSAGPSLPASGPAAVRSPPAEVVRAATNVEVCVQEKIAAATAGGKSLPLDAFDKIRAECGS